MKILITIFTVFCCTLCVAANFETEADSPFGSFPIVTKKEAQILTEASQLKTSEEVERFLKYSVQEKWAGAALLFNLGNACFKNGKYHEAREFYEGALEKHSAFFLARKNLGFLYSQMGDSKKAEVEMKKALALSGASDVAILLWLSSNAAEKQDFSSALTFCNQALLFDASNTPALMAKAKFLYELGNYSEAEKLALSLLKSDMHNKDALKILGLARFKNNDIVGAISAFELIQAMKISSSAETEFLADIYFNEGMYEAALTRYLKVPGSKNAESTALAMACTGRYKDALNAAFELNPKEAANLHKIKAIAYAGLGKEGDSILEWEAHLKSNPQDAHSQIALAKAYLKAGKIDLAEVKFAQVKAFPEFECAALYGMLGCKIKVNDVYGALKISRIINTKYPNREIADYIKYLEGVASQTD